MPSSIIAFKDTLNALSPRSASVQIKAAITTAFSSGPVWGLIESRLFAPGVGGTAQYDHCGVARIILDNTPELKAFSYLTEKMVWDHVVTLLRSRGYKMERGYVISNILGDTDPTESDKAPVTTAPTTDPDLNES